jgi:hypothetical protein
MIILDKGRPLDELRHPDKHERPQTIRNPYTPPTLEYVGRWSTLTLQQSVGVGFFTDLP